MLSKTKTHDVLVVVKTKDPCTQGPCPLWLLNRGVLSQRLLRGGDCVRMKDGAPPEIIDSILVQDSQVGPRAMLYLTDGSVRPAAPGMVKICPYCFNVVQRF